MPGTLGKVGLAVLLISAPTYAQTPQPFPRAGGAGPTPTVARPSPQQPVPAGVAPPPAPAAAAPAPASQAPAPAAPPQLGVPIYPTAQFLTSYDAGRGQRYYVFGTTASFADMVNYYRAQLRERGTLVFEEPPTHMFEVGRFREETMAFPPSVTIKDWTFGGSKGYPNPQRGAQPERFQTLVVIVPAPPGVQ